jgi:hypothetical protein
MQKESITQSELKELLDYDPDTGLFRWKVDRNQKAKKGTVAGTVMNTGYVMVHVKNAFITGHRLAWFFTYGVYPDCHIDHIDQDKTNNRISNLRLATNNHADNSQNRTVQSNNTTGCPGVHYCKRDKKFISRVSVGGIRHIVGYFITLEEAIEARKKAKELHHKFEPLQRGVKNA